MFNKEDYTQNRKDGRKGVELHMTVGGYLPEEWADYTAKTSKAERRGFTTKRERNAA